MDHKQKHTNLPMIVMTKLQHGGWYEYGKYYIDMDVSDPALFVEFYDPRRKNLSNVPSLVGWI